MNEIHGDDIRTMEMLDVVVMEGKKVKRRPGSLMWTW
jgi:hypothetical protein